MFRHNASSAVADTIVSVIRESSGDEFCEETLRLLLETLVQAAKAEAVDEPINFTI